MFFLFDLSISKSIYTINENSDPTCYYDLTLISSAGPINPANFYEIYNP